MRGELTCRPISSYPVPETRHRKRARFIASRGRPTPLSQTLDDLDRELKQLGCRRAVLELDVTESDIRNDGWPRSTANPATPRVVLSLPESKHGPLRYPCDAFTRWEDNLRAIALALQALRAVDRYGVTRHGEQYAGWKALPAATGPTMSVEAAARVIDGINPHQVVRDPSYAKQVIREAVRRTHPDTGGAADDFHLVQTARAVLAAYHGVSL